MSYQALKRKCELEQKVMAIISQDNGATAHFHYEDLPDGLISLTLVTTNPVHKEVFKLFTTAPHNNPYDCLDEVINYLEEVKRKDSGYLHYQFNWYRTDDPSQKFTSHFTGHRLYPEIMNKFYDQKNPDDFIIRSIEMKPIA